jgi:hypothetical protein
MRVLRFSSLALIALSFFACQKETSQDALGGSSALSKKLPPVNSTACEAYDVTLDVDHTTMPGKTIFTWSISNPNPGNGSNGTTQDLSHWNLVPGLCLDNNWQDLVYAGYRVGEATSFYEILNPTIKPDPSIKDCFRDDVFKFDAGTVGNHVSQFRLILNGHWNSASTSAYFKSGSNTGCCSKTIMGVGCRTNEDCSYSQGHWFNKPGLVWTVSIGGFSYDETEGRAIWDASNQGGIKDAKRAFTQLAAIRLSGVDETNPAISAAITTIDNWLASLGVKLTPTTLVDQTSAEITLYGNASAAASTISSWINANHCD